MREIDLLLREFSSQVLSSLDEHDVNLFDEILDYDDQSLYDFIFKQDTLGNKDHEAFIIKHLKNFNKQGNF
jgi:succinate dehydrogenase flavin-adding protein (antitoxin of CptAB toxin-antitoxin module)